MLGYSSNSLHTARCLLFPGEKKGLLSHALQAAVTDVLNKEAVDSLALRQKCMDQLESIPRIQLLLLDFLGTEKTQILFTGHHASLLLFAAVDLLLLLEQLERLTGGTGREKPLYIDTVMNLTDDADGVSHIFTQALLYLINQNTSDLGQDKLVVQSLVWGELQEAFARGVFYDVVWKDDSWAKLSSFLRIHLQKYDRVDKEFAMYNSLLSVWIPKMDGNLIPENGKEHKKLGFTVDNKGVLEFLLYRIWGFKEFREGQWELIRCLFSGKNTLGLMPTGSGKSICFQLPALLLPGITLVLSPLKSLMKDQVDHLKKLGLDCAEYIDSSRTPIQKREIMSRMQKGSLKLLYISPERFQIRSFQLELLELLQNYSVSCLVIDEAHCVSEWGHDFRPAYLKIYDVYHKLNSPVILALTATASKVVKEDILKILRIPDENVLSMMSLDRPEISFEVKRFAHNQKKDRVLQDILEHSLPSVLGYPSLQILHQNGTGLLFTIYASPEGVTTERYGTGYISRMLRSWGIDAGRYHSKLSDQERNRIQEAYLENKIPILVTTKGFGMGIDKPDIRYIIHQCLSNSLEAYYQEVGRGGRNGEHAHAILIVMERHPNCLKISNRKKQAMRLYEPSCVRGWTCPYTVEGKCDYGMQAKFIHEEYPTEREMKKQIKGFLKCLEKTSHHTSDFEYVCKEDELAMVQKHLFHLQQQEWVMDYGILAYRNDGITLQVIVGTKWNQMQKRQVVGTITAELQLYKRQKYTMLDTIYDYAMSTTCRREYMMRYFGQSISWTCGCGFCDIEGINKAKTGKDGCISV